jgi:hypothetical protein
MKSSVADQPAAPVDVVSLLAQYVAAFERYRAYFTKLVEHGGGAQPPPVHLLEAERLTLQEFARLRAALLEALVPVEPQIDPAILRCARDEAIRRSIAKRNVLDGAASAHRQRVDRRRKRALLIAVVSETTSPEQQAGDADEPRTADDRPTEGSA